MLVEDKIGKSICIKVFIKTLQRKKNWLQCLTIFTVMPLSGLFYGTTCSNGTSICIMLLSQAVTGVRVFSSLQFSCSVMPNSLQPHGLQHARPPYPSPTPRVRPNPCPLSQWCHPTVLSSVIPFSSWLQSFPASIWEVKYFLQVAAAAAAAAAKSLQSCLTLCDPIDSSPPGSSLSGILQARILEWVAISFSNACMHAKSRQSCQPLSNPMDSSPPGSSVHRIFQARIVEWVAISFSISMKP